jgi:hypothetical protein
LADLDASLFARASRRAALIVYIQSASAAVTASSVSILKPFIVIRLTAVDKIRAGENEPHGVVRCKADPRHSVQHAPHRKRLEVVLT